MPIIGTLPTILTNGTTADATQVMSDFNFIVSQVNANAATAGANSNITSILGLTTPLATGQGGTGASTAGASLLQNIGAPAFMRGMIAGLQISSVGSSSVAITAGVCCDSSGVTLITLPAFSKLTTGVWAAGSGANGLGTGVSLSSNSTFHLMAIACAGSFDAYFDTSLTAANAPASTTGYRRIMSVRTTTATTSLAGLTQVDDTFLYTGAPITDLSAVAISNTTAYSGTLSVPLGINVEALIDVVFGGGAVPANTLCWVSSLLQTDTAVVGNAQMSVDASGTFAGSRVPTIVNSSGQVRYRASGTSAQIYFTTSGWKDTRGRTGLS